MQIRYDVVADSNGNLHKFSAANTEQRKIRHQFAILFRFQDYSLNMYLRQEWSDPRLAFDPAYNDGSDKLKLGDGYWERIWTPDVFFRNEKKAAFHGVTTPNRLINLHADGTVWYVSK